MPPIRTFIAVEIDPRAKETISELISYLKRSGADVKWIDEHQMHLTLKFLGNIEEPIVQKISDVLKSIAGGISAFTIRFSKTGAFPNMKSPRVIWFGLDKGSDEMKLLAERVETEMEKLGFPKEKRDYKAHLTLGRVRSSKNLSHLTKLINETNPSTSPRSKYSSSEVEKQIWNGASLGAGETKIDKLILFKSTLAPKGAIYTPLASLPLSR